MNLKLKREILMDHINPSIKTSSRMHMQSVDAFLTPAASKQAALMNNTFKQEQSQQWLMNLTRHTPQKSQKKIFNQLKLRLKQIQLKDANAAAAAANAG